MIEVRKGKRKRQQNTKSGDKPDHIEMKMEKNRQVIAVSEINAGRLIFL